MGLNEERLNYHITNIHLWCYRPTCYNMRYYFQVYPRIMVLVVRDNLKRKNQGNFMMILCTLYNFFTVFTSFFVLGLVLRQFDNLYCFFFLFVSLFLNWVFKNNTADNLFPEIFQYTVFVGEGKISFRWKISPSWFWFMFSLNCFSRNLPPLHIKKNQPAIVGSAN